MIYQEMTAYSPVDDCEVTRLSTCDDQNHEFFCLVRRIPRFKKGANRPTPWREIRQTALEQLAEAIQAGSEPGQFNITLDT